MIRKLLSRLFSGEVGSHRTSEGEKQMLPPPMSQHERATQAQKAYLDALESGDRDSKALPSNVEVIVSECPILKMGNYRSEF